MKSKRLFFYVLTALFFISQSLWAQSARSNSQGSGRYIIEQRYVQQLVWVQDKYAFKYEVIIELDEGGGYSAYLREFTESSSFRVSLPPGNYRYCIIPYDYLEQSGDPSEWVTLDIKPAPIVPVEIKQKEDGSYVLHPYEEEQLVPGVNEIVIQNPEELSAEDGVLDIKKQNRSYLSVAWSPLFPLYGGIYKIFGDELNFFSGTLCFGVIFDILDVLDLFNPGLEMSTSFYLIKSIQNNDEIMTKAGETVLNIVMQWMSDNRKASLRLKTGGGIAFHVGELEGENYFYSIGSVAPIINFDMSFLYYIKKHFYAEIGLTFVHFLSVADSSGYFRPLIGIGWQF
ncbi:MAG: hypothetical protein LBV17_06715 [Treponema sp.]|jgi:hypothetical protein|nr:hypothetical protein [Treponema sp.]